MHNLAIKNKISSMLLKRGFVKIEPSSYANEVCNVVYDGNEAIVANNAGVQNFLPLDYQAVFDYLESNELIRQTIGVKKGLLDRTPTTMYY